MSKVRKSSLIVSVPLPGFSIEKEGQDADLFYISAEVSVPLPGFSIEKADKLGALITSLSVSVPLPGFSIEKAPYSGQNSSGAISFSPVAGIQY